MQVYFEQLRSRISAIPLESSNEILEIVQRVSTGFDETSSRLISTELELKVARQQASELASAEKEIESVRAKLEEAVQEKARFVITMNSQQSEINRLAEEVRSQYQSLESASLSKSEALSKICDIESVRFSLDCRVNQLEMEVNSLRHQLTWATDTLSQRNSEIEELRCTSSQKVIELQRQMTENGSELEAAQQLHQSMEKVVKEHQEQIAELCAKLREAEINYTTMEQRYSAELQASKRRDRLYRDNTEDDRRQISEVSSRLNELDSLSQSKEARIVQLLGECDKIKAEALKAQQERDQKITALTKELENANHLLAAAKQMGIPFGDSDVTPLSPAAVVAGRLMKSGLSITQMYTKFLDISDACQLKDIELNGLKEMMSKVHEELERKGPELKRQREELESAKREVISLREKFDEANKEKVRWQRIIKDRDEKMIVFERERQSLRLKCSDLSKQVQLLLSRVEIAEGRRKPPEEESTQISSSSGNQMEWTSAEFISQHLVEFKDIQELQQQNERLLALIRELSSDKEAEDELRKKIKDLENELSRSKNDFEELQTTQRRTQDLLNTVSQQRDSLKLISQSPSRTGPQDRTGSESTMAVAGSFAANVTSMSTPRPLTISRVTSSSSIVGSPNHAQKIEEELQITKKRLADRETEFVRLQNELTSLKIQLSEHKSAATSAENRSKLADQRVESAQREADLIRAKSIKQDLICAQLESTVATMRAEMQTCRDLIKQRESEIGAVRREIDEMKMNCVKTAAERDALRRTEQSTTMLLASMESLKRVVSEDKREDRRRSLDRTADLDRELAAAKLRLDEEKHRRSELVKQLELQLSTVQKQLLAEQEAHQRTQNMLTAATSTLAPDSDSAQADLERRQHAEQLASNNTELRLEVEENRRKLTLLEEEKRQMDVKQVELSNFTSSLESTLAEQKSINDNLARSLRDVQAELENKCAEFEAVRAQVEAARLGAENERDQAMSKLDLLQQSSQSEILQLRHSVVELGSERDALREEKLQWSNVVNEAESKYNDELQKHAASMEHLRTTRQKVTDLEKKISAFEREKADMASRLSAADHRLNEVESQAQAAVSEADKYRQQLQALLEKVTVGESGESTTMDTTDEEADLVKFLRRERSLLQSRLDVADAEISRLKMSVTMTQREASDLRAALNEERKQRQLLESPAKPAQTATPQIVNTPEIQRRLESLDSVLDANRMLREEKNHYEAELRKLREKGEGSASGEGGAPFKQRLNDLQGQLNVLQAEKQAALTDAERWQKKVQQLMEQMKRSEIDELKKAAAERDTLRGSLAQRLEKIRQQEQEIAALKQQIEAAKQEIETVRSACTANKTEADDVKSQLSKMNDTNQQLRKIAQKYKQQYLDTDKALKEKTGGVPIASALPGASAPESAPAAASSDSAVADLEAKLVIVKGQLDELMRKLGDVEREKAVSQGEVTQLKKQLEDSNKKYSDISKLFSSSRAELREAVLRSQTLAEELEEAKTAKTDMERRYNDLQKQYNELHDLYEALERENRDLSTKLRELLRTGSITPGSSSGTAQLPVASSVHGQTTSSSATSVAAVLSTSSTTEFSPLMDTSGTAGQATVAVSPAAVVHPRLRSQQTATVLPTNVHAPPSRLAPPAPIPPIRVWPTVRQQQPTTVTTEPTAVATSSQPTTEINLSEQTVISQQEQQASSPAAVLEPSSAQQTADQGAASSGRTAVQPQKRTRQQASFGQTIQVSPGEGSSIVGSSSDNLAGTVDSAESETNKRRRMLLQSQNQQSVTPFTASSEQMSEDDLLLEAAAGSSNQPQPTEPAVGAGGAETEPEEEEQHGDDLGDQGGDLVVDVGPEQASEDDGFDFENGPGDEQPHSQPPAISSEINPAMGEEGEESGEGADYGGMSSQETGQTQQRISESRYEAVDSLDYGDQVVGSSGDNDIPLTIVEMSGTSVVTMTSGLSGGIEVQHSDNIDQSEVVDEEDDMSQEGGVAVPETGGEEEEEHLEQHEEGSSQGGFLGGSGQFGSSSQPSTETSASATWSFGPPLSQPLQTSHQTIPQAQPQSQSQPNQPPPATPPSQQQHMTRPRIEPIIWEASPATSTAGPAPIPAAGGRRLNVRSSAPNMFFQQAPQPGQQMHAQMVENGANPQVSPQRMPRPSYPATRARGFGAVPFPPPTRGRGGGPRRGA